MVHIDAKDIQKAGFDKEKVKQCWIKGEKKNVSYDQRE